MKQEIWENIEFGNGKYSVSNLGEVKNNFTDIIVPKQIQNSGYYVVSLTYKGKRKTATIHRQEALVFVPLIPGKDFVDHIDNNKLNNNSENLRWTTRFENMQYAVQNGCLKNAAKKAAIRMKVIGDKYGYSHSQKYLKKSIPLKIIINNEIVDFESIRKAAIFFSVDHKTICNRIKKGVLKVA